MKADTLIFSTSDFSDWILRPDFGIVFMARPQLDAYFLPNPGSATASHSEMASSRKATVFRVTGFPHDTLELDARSALAETIQYLHREIITVQLAISAMRTQHAVQVGGYPNFAHSELQDEADGDPVARA
jgi:hypothetical protein